MLKSIIFLYNQLYYLRDRKDLTMSEKFEMAIRMRMRLRRTIRQWSERTPETPRFYELLRQVGAEDAAQRQRHKC